MPPILVARNSTYTPRNTVKMDKLFILDYLSPCFIKLGVVRLCIFCVVMQLPESYENKRLPIGNCNAHLDFRGMQVFCVVLQKKMLY